MDDELTPLQKIAANLVGFAMALPMVLAVWAAKVAVACLVVRALLFG